MNLQDIYNQLSYGELRLLFIGGDDIDDVNQGMSTAQFTQLLPTIDLGLIALYKRFCLKEGEFTLNLQTGQSTYALQHDYAQSNTASPASVKFIDDTAFPFTGELFKVERVYGTYLAEQYKVPINEIDNPLAVRTPSHNFLTLPTDTIKAPWLLETTALKVFYRTGHPKIDSNVANIAPLVTDIELPATYLEALCFFVASRISNPLGMQPGAQHEGNNYFQRYEQECALLRQQNYEIDDFTDSDKFAARGFA